jgi:hypothetical protein
LAFSGIRSQFKIFFLGTLLLLGGLLSGCMGGLNLSGASPFGANLVNPGQSSSDESNTDAGNSEDSTGTSPSGAPPSGSPSGSPASNGSAGKIIISGSVPSGQPTSVISAPVILPCSPGSVICQDSSHHVWEKDISGAFLPTDTSDTKQSHPPLDRSLTVVLWEKKKGESGWSPSTDLNDQVIVDAYGRFWHRLRFESEGGICDRSIKFVATFEGKGSTQTVESGEFDCYNLPPTDTSTVFVPCITEVPGGDGDAPPDRPWRGGKNFDEDRLTP